VPRLLARLRIFCAVRQHARLAHLFICVSRLRRACAYRAPLRWHIGLLHIAGAAAASVGSTHAAASSRANTCAS